MGYIDPIREVMFEIILTFQFPLWDTTTQNHFQAKSNVPFNSLYGIQHMHQVLQLKCQK